MVYHMDNTRVMHDADGNEVAVSDVLTDRQQQTVAYLQAAHGGCPASVDDCGEPWVGGLRVVTLSSPVGALVATLLGGGESILLVDED